MGQVVIGVDPHKASNTLVVIDREENVLAQQRFDNTREGYREMKTFARVFRDRTWAVEGARGVGASLAQRLVAENEPVLNIPPKLSARVRALNGDSARKTDDADAFAVAVAGLRAKKLRPVTVDGSTEIVRMLVERREELVQIRVATVNRLHDTLCHLIPGGAGQHLTSTGARAKLSLVRPRDAVGKARKQLALDYIGDFERLDSQIKALRKQLVQIVEERGSTLPDIDGIAALGASKILAETLDVRRFPSRHHYASYTGTAPVDVSSGDHNRHKLNRGGNRRLNHVLHVAAVTQARMPGPGREYYLRKRAEGKTHLEAMRCLKRRISDAVYRALVHDQELASPGGQVGATLQSSAADTNPMVGTSEQSQPGLNIDPTPDIAAAS